jgi:hypothetical protein
VRIIFEVSEKYCAACFITDFHAFEVILPLFIEMSLYHNSGIAFHFYNIKYSAKVRDTQEKKITRAGDFKGDFYNDFAVFRSE